MGPAGMPYISTADPDALFEEYRSGGVAFRQPSHG